MKIVSSLILLLLLNVMFIPTVYAQGTNHFVTIVNPVRISAYTPNPQASLAAEYSEIYQRQLSATWLITYDALNNE